MTSVLQCPEDIFHSLKQLALAETSDTAEYFFIFQNTIFFWLITFYWFSSYLWDHHISVSFSSPLISQSMEYAPSNHIPFYSFSCHLAVDDS